MVCQYTQLVCSLLLDVVCSIYQCNLPFGAAVQRVALAQFVQYVPTVIVQEQCRGTHLHACRSSFVSCGVCACALAAMQAKGKALLMQAPQGPCPKRLSSTLVLVLCVMLVSLYGREGGWVCQEGSGVGGLPKFELFCESLTES